MEKSKLQNIERLIEQKGAQFRSFEIREAQQDEEGEKLTITGMPVAFNSDTLLYSFDEYDVYERILPEAFNGTDMSDVIFNYNHAGRVYARTRNDSLKLDLKKDGLYMETELWADDSGHRQLYNDISRGNIDKMSFAFTVSDDDVEELENGDYLRTIRGIDRLFDVSAVDIPAYGDTFVEASARSGLDARIGELEKVKNEVRLADAKRRLAEALNK